MVKMDEDNDYIKYLPTSYVLLFNETGYWLNVIFEDSKPMRFILRRKYSESHHQGIVIVTETITELCCWLDGYRHVREIMETK